LVVGVVAAGASDGGGGLVLVSAGTDSLTVGWSEGFAPGSAGFVLRWRLDRVAGGVEATVWGVDVAAGARSYTVAGLAVATRYRFELVAVDVDGAEGGSARGTFETLAPPVRSVSASVVAPDAVRVGWDGPPGWLPVGYAVQWRARGTAAFAGRLEAPAGRRELTVTGLAGGVDYEFRVTARTAGGWQGQPLAVAVATPAVPETTLRLDVNARHYCVAEEGYNRGKGSGGPPEGRYWVRHGVPSVPVYWRVSGGQAPYVVRVAGVETRAASGATEVTCAKAGIDLNYLKDPDVDVVESGPKVITVEVADAAGATVTRTHVIEIIEELGSAGYYRDDFTPEPGRTYYHAGRFLENPEGEERIGWFGYTIQDPAPGASLEDFVYELEVWHTVGDENRSTQAMLDSSTGERFAMVVLSRERAGMNWEERYYWGEDVSGLTAAEIDVWDRFFAGMRATPFPEGDPRNESYVSLYGVTPPGR
ncbi:MAG: fibronectin type III domain-containing protein, partial [bacterium]|nr:fibronectin type III domain-containing protein [bacterium]